MKLNRPESWRPWRATHKRCTLCIMGVNLALLFFILSTSLAHAVGPYTANTNTVIDQGTTLEWQKGDDGTTRTWPNALAYCENLSLDSKTDWRLPNIRELGSIYDASRSLPSIDPAFTCQSSFYWSASTYAGLPAYAWNIYFYGSGEGGYLKTDSHYVRCVRGGQSGQTHLKLSSFPLRGYTHQTAPITSVFDHSMTGSYVDNNIVVAYTGERGESQFGSNLVWSTHFGFRQNNAGTPFRVNGNYTGGGKSTYLYYDGHPGFDYSTGGKNLPVYPAASGTAHRGNLGLGEIYIDHGNGYTTHYLHLCVDGNLIANNSKVDTSTKLGLAGGTGGFPVHLHFEVRHNLIPVDPYGWQGIGTDPYTAATNVNLWGDSSSILKMIIPVMMSKPVQSNNE